MSFVVAGGGLGKTLKSPCREAIESIGRSCPDRGAPELVSEAPSVLLAEATSPAASELPSKSAHSDAIEESAADDASATGASTALLGRQAETWAS